LYLAVFMGRFLFWFNVFLFLGGVSILIKYLPELKIKTWCLQYMVKSHKHLYITCQKSVCPALVLWSFHITGRCGSECLVVSSAVCTSEREGERDIRFEFRFVSLLVITQCFPTQRLRCACLAASEAPSAPAVMYCLPATCHDGASLNTLLLWATWTQCCDCPIVGLILHNRPQPPAD
jgi:hypothetical protein